MQVFGLRVWGVRACGLRRGVYALKFLLYDVGKCDAGLGGATLNPKPLNLVRIPEVRIDLCPPTTRTVDRIRQGPYKVLFEV